MRPNPFQPKTTVNKDLHWFGENALDTTLKAGYKMFIIILSRCQFMVLSFVNDMTAAISFASVKTLQGKQPNYNVVQSQWSHSNERGGCV